MIIAGIVAEYNPFHNGHAYHIRETRKRTGCDYVVAVMSGAFTQRGECALMDKWTRAKMALGNGVDLVLELPALFSVRPADWFAAGGVGLLGALNAVSVISFGCETDDIVALSRMAEALENESPELSLLMRKKLDEGMSHARARGEALSELMGVPGQLVNAPNTVLALEYIRANSRLERPMELCCVRREYDYHSDELHPFASAGAIRRAAREGRIDEAAACLPESAAELLRKSAPDGFSRERELDALMLYTLRDMTGAYLADMTDVNEGLEKRILKMAPEATSRAELLRMAKCKRYTMARISRICAYAMLDIPKELSSAYDIPPYARVLGFRDKARPLLRYLASNSDIPLVSDPMVIRDDPVFELERRATDLWGLTARAEALRRAGRDLTQKMLIELD